MIFAKKSKFHDAGGPDTVVSPRDDDIINNKVSVKAAKYPPVSARTIDTTSMGSMHGVVFQFQ